MKRICITGPEATGKSTLARALAEVHGTQWVPEFARSYLTHLERPYVYEDLDAIVAGQLNAESVPDSAESPFLFCDTGPEVVWIWSDYKFGTVSPKVDQATRETRYTHTLLLDTDLPWHPDPLRENPNPEERKELFHRYENLLQELGRSYTIVNGTGDQRLRNAVEAMRWVER